MLKLIFLEREEDQRKVRRRNAEAFRRDLLENRRSTETLNYRIDLITYNKGQAPYKLFYIKTLT